MTFPQREFKFRAWDTKYNRMIYLGWRWQNDFGVIPINHDWDHVVDDEHLHFMQWTGSLDADNKPIYEGDVLGLKGADDMSRAVVIYKGNAFRMLFQGWDKTIEGPILSMYLPWLIIGNIFMNPELLNE